MLKTFEAIAETTSRKEKERLLKENTNPLMGHVLFLTYSPFVVFGIKELPDDIVGGNEEFSAQTVSLLQAVADVWSLGDSEAKKEAKERLFEHVDTLNPDGIELVRRILARDIRAGISAKTINKVFGAGTIPEWPVMLCQSYSEKNLKNIRFPAYIQEKCDGMRVNIVVENGNVRFYGRSGKPIYLTDGCRLERSIEKLAEVTAKNGVVPNKFVLDGELLVLADDMSSYCERKIGNGILNKAIRGTITPEESDRVVARLWDFIDYDAFVKANPVATPYEDRLNELCLFIDWAYAIDGVEANVVGVVETHLVNNIDEARRIYHYIVAKGGEGAVLKNVNSHWVPQRSKDQVKMKIENEVELRVVGIVEGTGKHEGSLGALICSTDDGGLRVKVGSGFTDKQRAEFWERNGEVVGSVVTVKANDYIRNVESDTLALFLPVFIELRQDKDETNTTEEIVEGFDTIYGRQAK